jgi:hypothetical protein
VTKQQNSNQQTTESEAGPQTVAAAEATLARFERERNDVLDRKTLLADKRREIAFDALSGDKSASKLLDGLHREAFELEARLGSVNDALAEAGRRLERARQHAAQAADRQRALSAARAAEKCWEHGAGIEAALSRLREHINGRYEALRVMHENGVRYPSFEQQDGLFYRRIVGVMYDTPLRPRFEVVSPAERARAVTAIDDESWKPMVSRTLAPRLGDGEQINHEQQKTATEAA